jgi:hypothetical protein
VLSEKKILNETKKHNPPPPLPVKWTVPNVTYENEKNKLYMLKHYFCKYAIDRDTLFWGSYSLSFICGHIGLCAFTFILVDQFWIMFYPCPSVFPSNPCPSVFPSIMFWFPFNNLSLPWTWSNVLKFGCAKNHK